jgi:predicted anti-sigma-YlaC factor YlaD
MVGMLQILTYLLAFYLVLKGIEILQMALTSNREKRHAVIIIGALTLAACLVASVGFAVMQDNQAASLSRSAPLIP